MDQQYQHQKKLILFTIQAVVLTGLGLTLLFVLRNILMVWFIAFVLMTALNPIVEFFTRLRVPRSLGIVLAMVIVIAFVSLLSAGIIPTLIRETNSLIAYISQYIDYLQYFQIDQTIISQLETLSRGALNIVKIIGNTFSNLLSLVSLIVLTIYLLVERYRLKYVLQYAFRGKQNLEKAEAFLNDIEHRLGGWIRAEAALMLLIGVLCFASLTLMHVPFALPLAILAGLLELVPNIGPIISAIPAIAAGLSVSPAVAAGVLVLYIAIQQLENHVIVPLVMKQSVGINPLITLFCLMVGSALGGIVGAILSVPLYMTLRVVVQTINRENHLSIPVPDDEA